MKNDGNVKYLFNKWSYKVSELIANNKSLRNFLYYTVTVLFVVYPALAIINNIVEFYTHK